VLSPLAPPPDVALETAQSTGAASDQPGDVAVETAVKDSDVVEAAPGTSVGKIPDADNLNGVSAGDTQPADKPEVDATAETLAVPAAPAAEPEVQIPAGDAPADLPTATARVADAPAQDSNVTAQTDVPARPEVADMPVDGQGLNGEATQSAASPTVTTQTDPVAPRQDRTASISEPQADTLPSPSTSPPQPPKTATPADEPAPAQIAALPQAGTDSQGAGPTVGKRVVPLTERKAATITVDPVAPDDAAVDSADLPPLQRYAAPFENPENKPLMSIVLIDDDGSIGAEALQEFPYPLSFAIDPTSSGAAEKMARHRAAGFEVVALIDMPEGATAQDAEVSLAASFNTLTEAVGVLEGTGRGIRGNRDVSGQVADFVKSTGRGMVTQDSGLNTAYKLALREGVPAAVVFRDFDGAGQDPDLMRRFLDQAAFRAAQDGGVIMMGRVRPDTISALLLWGLQDRASRVALAPLSAVLAQSQTAN